MRDLAFLFSGQGSQYVGMGRELCDNFAIARRTFEEAEDILKIDLRTLCVEGDLKELTETANAQPAILTLSIASWRTYMQEVGIKPKVVAGHSLGEYAALVCSGAMTFSQAVKLVRKRGLLMQDEAQGGIGAMSSITGIDRAVVEEVCRSCSNINEIVSVSNINSSSQIVISGHKHAVGAAGDMLKEMGGSVLTLNVSAPFHSSLMQPASEALKTVLQSGTYAELKYIVIANVDGKPYASSDQIVDCLTEQLTAPVRWLDTMNWMYDFGVRTVIEFGPGKVLRNLMKKEYGDVQAFSYDHPEDVLLAKKALGIPLDRQPFVPTVLTKCLAIAVATKNRNFDQTEYQKGVIDPYRHVQSMQLEIEALQTEPTINQMQVALEMLQSVFDTKKTPKKEQIERFNEIFEETGTRYLLAENWI